MKVLQFIAAAFLAASIGAMTGAAFADLPQVYQSNSTGEVKGWEDAEGYHACKVGKDCRVLSTGCPTPLRGAKLPALESQF